MSSPPSLSPAHNGPCKSLLSSIHPRPPSAEEFSMTGLSDPARMRRRKSIGGGRRNGWWWRNCVLYYISRNEYPFKEINRRTLFPRSVSIRRENLKEASNSNGIWKTMYVWISEREQKRLWKLMMDRSIIFISSCRCFEESSPFSYFFFFLSILSMVSLDDTFVSRLIVGLRETSNSIFNNRADSR